MTTRTTIPAQCRSLLEQTARLTALPPADALRLADGEPFDFASGLRARFVPDEGHAPAVRTQVLLGLPANALAGDAVSRFIALQTALAADGNWQLGMGLDGQLALTAMTARDGASAVAADLHIGCIVAWLLLRVLLNEPFGDDDAVAGAGHGG